MDGTGNLAMKSTGYNVMGWQADDTGMIKKDEVSPLRIMQEKNLAVEFLWPQEFQITADEGRMAQVVTNLATNAIKYSPEGGTIYVRNQKNNDTSDVATWIPAAARGDSAADFANAKLVIADRGVVAIGAAKMKFAELTIEENSLLDLHGEYVRVKRATVGGTRLAGGKYTAETLPQFLADSGEGGVLDIGGGLSIVVR